MSILWETDPTTADNLRLVLGDGMRVVDSGPVAVRQLSEDRRESLLVVGADIDLTAALSVVEGLRLERPEVGVVLMRRRLDVTVLAQALRAGVREVVSSDDLATLTDACQRSRELSQRLGSVGEATPSHQGRVVTVFAAKGGVGKTTMSTNLAAELATAGSKVLLVDLDLAFGDVAITLGLMPERTSADLVAMSGHLDEHGLASVVTPTRLRSRRPVRACVPGRGRADPRIHRHRAHPHRQTDVRLRRHRHSPFFHRTRPGRVRRQRRLDPDRHPRHPRCQEPAPHP